jgi:type 1 fimbria pilin
MTRKWTERPWAWPVSVGGPMLLIALFMTACVSNRGGVIHIGGSVTPSGCFTVHQPGAASDRVCTKGTPHE